MNEQKTKQGGDEIVLVFDTKLRRPACVLIQALYGCGENNGFLQMTFDTKTWLVAPTPDMIRIKGTKEQWEKMAKQTNAK